VDLEISNSDNRSETLYTKYIGALPGGTCFGAAHCCDWFFAFPTVQELLLWRTVSVLTTTASAILVDIAWRWGNLQGCYMFLYGWLLL